MKYLFDQPTLNARQSRWLEFLCEYDFDIKLELVTKLQQGKMLQKVEDYKLEADGTLLYKNRIYVPNSRN
jgi:hypothetical protein